MPELKIQTLSEQEAIEQIVETVEQADEGTAPFVLVLGSGFSQGLVPTARELVSESLPLWMKSRKDKKSFETQKEVSAEQRAEIAREFWRDFVRKNAGRDLVLDLDDQTGLPKTYSDAYKAIFTTGYAGAVGDPALARKFQRALMRLDKSRLNTAHFLLASLLGVQPGKSRKNDLFKARAAFSRLILTTNFDPFLQTALQAVNRLYFMSDTPEVGVSNEILDDETDAIHLVYVHGTIHRRLQATSDEEIQALKEKNAKTLAPVLERHGVIFLGYSGWDDAIVEALGACKSFDYRLYWCGLEADPLARGAFGPRVAGILGKSSAMYVQTTGAGRFMARLLAKLVVNGLPRLLDNPIAQVREMLESIDLGELKNLSSDQARVSTTAQVIDATFNSEAFVLAKERARRQLLEAEQLFRIQPVAPTTDEAKKQIQQLLSSARLAAALGNHDETLKLCSKALKLAPEPADLAALLLIQGLAHYLLRDHDNAISSRSQIAELPDAPVEQVAAALRNRGILWGQKGETEKALADYTHVIEQLPGAPVSNVAEALTNRGWMRYLKDDFSAFLADTEAALNKLPSLDFAAFNLGLALLAVRRDAEALQAYRHAGERFRESIDALGLGDLEDAKKKWLGEQRAQTAIQLLHSLRK
jgi:tetratricopeptide (TPR) repeat protein